MACKCELTRDDAEVLKRILYYALHHGSSKNPTHPGDGSPVVSVWMRKLILIIDHNFDVPRIPKQLNVSVALARHDYEKYIIKNGFNYGNSGNQGYYGVYLIDEHYILLGAIRWDPRDKPRVIQLAGTYIHIFSCTVYNIINTYPKI